MAFSSLTEKNMCPPFALQIKSIIRLRGTLLLLKCLCVEKKIMQLIITPLYNFFPNQYKRFLQLSCYTIFVILQGSFSGEGKTLILQLRESIHWFGQVICLPPIALWGFYSQIGGKKRQGRHWYRLLIFSGCLSLPKAPPFSFILFSD